MHSNSRGTMPRRTCKRVSEKDRPGPWDWHAQSEMSDKVMNIDEYQAVFQPEGVGIHRPATILGGMNLIISNDEDSDSAGFDSRGSCADMIDSGPFGP